MNEAWSFGPQANDENGGKCCASAKRAQALFRGYRFLPNDRQTGSYPETGPGISGDVRELDFWPVSQNWQLSSERPHPGRTLGECDTYGPGAL